MVAPALLAPDDDAGPTVYPSPRRVPAWLMSVALHTCLLILAALLVQSPVNGPATEPERTGGIAIVQRNDAETTYFTNEDFDTDSTFDDATSADSPTDSASEPSPLAELPVEAAIQLPGAEDPASGTGLGSVLPGAIGFTTGSQGARSLAGGQARTQVFGAEGTGSKFVYVFDRSASMEGFQGRPMAAAKSQLIRSLGDLESVHQFQIVFYNEAPAVFHPDRSRPPRILFASQANKSQAIEFVERITGVGGTRHLEALRIALGMNPDVIFFLTDAAEPQLTPAELSNIRRRNRSEATINTIEFGSGPQPRGDNFLARLARQNHGVHVYVDVTQLR